MEMCSKEEIDLRISLGNISKYERDPISLEIDKKRMVKIYIRNENEKPRSLLNLLKTTNYLLNLLIDTPYDINELRNLYLFLKDRLKAVRKDLKRNEEDCSKIRLTILGLIIVFYIY